MPLPSDLWASPTWRTSLDRGMKTMGTRTTQQMLHHAPEELYDLENDPMETRNLAGSSKHASVLAELRRKVYEFRKRTEDPWLRYFDRISATPVNL
jgi:hypothetical protein